jgi:acylphosphatase
MLKQAHLFVKGDVIGVGFRAWTKIQTKQLAITGWVRNVFNREDVFGKHGGVEVVVQGDEKDVERMIEAIKNGPPIARIDAVEVISQDAKEVFESFEIRKSESY